MNVTGSLITDEESDVGLLRNRKRDEALAALERIYEEVLVINEDLSAAVTQLREVEDEEHHREQ